MSDFYRPPRRGARRRAPLLGKVGPVPVEFIVDEDLLDIPGVDDEQHGTDRMTVTERKQAIQRRYYGWQHKES